MKISVIVPAYNEVENIPHLVKLFREFNERQKEKYEVIIVDDGSTDGTYDKVRELTEGISWIKVVQHKRNLGKTEALSSGAKVSTGEVLVIYDADMQYDIDDIPRLLKLIEDGADVATGWKTGDYEKKFVSKVYNILAGWLFGLKIHDLNSIKAFRRAILDEMPMRKDWHRYIIPFAKEAGARIEEIKVNLRPRRYGKPKYSSPGRIIIGFYDLLAVKFQLSFLKKPMLYFGGIGGFLILAGFLAGILAIILRIFGHGFRPLLYLVILFILSGLLFFGLALIGEAVAAIIERIERLEKKI
ncbi:MAG: glycosyltransferase family 2 protein [candidate division WOR-3 bacterium]